ncbi:S1 RNA-binding domain-containing protein [Spirulina subsalsa]|uniref:S1 RNA-binding domain-containing protein n=1 Tax=Spirulina subsalsa TaxID=54311 RepID=UPI000315D868|nr:S1 RNA-binding domain-containing protein [Spirulina subsalsa]
MTSESTRPPKANVAFSMDDFAKALEQEQYDYVFQRGQVVRGRPLEYTTEGVFVDIGGKSSAFVPKDEAALGAVEDLRELLPMDEELEFVIIREQDADGQVILSRRQLALKQAWSDLVEMQTTGQSLQVRIKGVNRGGVIGEVKGLRAFIPRSHLVEKEDLDSLVGQQLTVTCLQVDPESKKLVLSQREAARSQAMKQVEAGGVVSGKVVSLKPYGAFVETEEGVTGLLHISQVSGLPIHDIHTVLQVGQQIKVVITEIDEYKNRISLSTKILEAYPGELLENLAAVMSNAQERLAAANNPSQSPESESSQVPE